MCDAKVLQLFAKATISVMLAIFEALPLWIRVATSIRLPIIADIAQPNCAAPGYYYYALLSKQR
jgi:hypothetical protein